MWVTGVPGSIFKSWNICVLIIACCRHTLIVEPFVGLVLLFVEERITTNLVHGCCLTGAGLESRVR